MQEALERNNNKEQFSRKNNVKILGINELENETEAKLTERERERERERESYHAI